jgi:16S rRNA processing protein RimM
VARGSGLSLVRVGRIGRTHGLRGELALDGSSLTPAELEAVRVFTWRGRAGGTQLLTLESVRAIHSRMLVVFAGFGDRDRALELVRGELLAQPGQLPDPGPDVAYTFQLIGLAVHTEDGRLLGNLADIIPTGAHPVYVVTGERELLIPATPEVLKRVDLAAGVITVALPPGLEEI